MKKLILIAIVILSAIFLEAASVVPSPLQKIEGTLRWTHNSTCSLPDYISMDALGQEDVYLTGIGFPTHGELQGCHIWAKGTSLTGSAIADGCTIFRVQRYSLACPTSLETGR